MDRKRLVELEWDAAGPALWQELLGRGRSGLQQGWSYGEALGASGVPLHRALVRGADGRPIACLQVAERRLVGPVGVALLLRGSVWLEPGSRAAAEPAVIEGVRRHVGRRALVWSPEAPSLSVRRALVTGYSTAWLDLGAGPETLRRGLAADWRACLRQAEAGPLAVRADPGRSGVDWLLDRNEAHRRQVGYRGPSRGFLGQLARTAREAGELMALVAVDDSEPVAGVMLLRHGASATYEVGYASASGRALRATHLLLWRAAELLASRGVRWLDLGGIATDRSPGIARFKLGMGGTVATLPGTFLIAGRSR
jgi:Acetyltransferase (GNAT) domain